MGNVLRAGMFISSIFLFSHACGFNGDLGRLTDPRTNGSQLYPWLIEDLADFDVFANNTLYWAEGVHAKLMTDIDLGGRVYTKAVIAGDNVNDSTFQGVKFAGRFNGNSHNISNLNISSAAGFYVGLFGLIESGILTNLKLQKFSINGYGYVGGLCGMIRYGSIRQCSTTGTVRGNSYVGGLCGEVSFGSGMSDNYATGNVNGNSYVGGLCGYNSCTIDWCYATADITGNSNFGGFCGYNALDITKCFSVGRVSGSGTTTSFAGGFCGTNDGSVQDCYSTGAVTRNATYLQIAGGFCGANTGEIDNCYSAGSVIASDYIGGFCGVNFQAITNSFWDMQTSGMMISSGGEAKTTMQMQTMLTYTVAGWDFSEDNWGADLMLREGQDYPRLAWQTVYAGDIAGLYGVDMVDLMELAANWLETGCPIHCDQADIDASGKVNLNDFAILEGDWLEHKSN